MFLDNLRSLCQLYVLGWGKFDLVDAVIEHQLESVTLDQITLGRVAFPANEVSWECCSFAQIPSFTTRVLSARYPRFNFFSLVELVNVYQVALNFTWLLKWPARIGLHRVTQPWFRWGCNPPIGRSTQTSHWRIHIYGHFPGATKPQLFFVGTSRTRVV